MSLKVTFAFHGEPGEYPGLGQRSGHRLVVGLGNKAHPGCRSGGPEDHYTEDDKEPGGTQPISGRHAPASNPRCFVFVTFGPPPIEPKGRNSAGRTQAGRSIGQSGRPYAVRRARRLLNNPQRWRARKQSGV